MAIGRKMRLGDMQLAILRVLWDAGAATVGDVHKALAQQGEVAYTTVATMLRKMEGRGLVRHREDGRRFVYEAAVSADGVTTSLAGDMLDRIFEGSLADLVSHLLSTRDVSAAELDRLERMIAERRQRP